VNTVLAEPPVSPPPAQPGLGPAPPDPATGPDPSTTPPAPEAPLATGPSCRHCGTAMGTDQDWCLECGTAAPGRLGRRGGWRMATSVTGLTALIASGIVAASYAALSSDSKHAVSRAAPVVAAAPVTPAPAASTPVVTPPATPPVTPAPVAPKAIKPVPAPKVTPAPVATPTPAATPTTSTPKATTPKATPKPAGPQPILLDTDAASIYDPANHPQGTFGDPSSAIDQDPGTAWTATLDATGKLGAGINIDLKSPHKVGLLRITTDTPGMAVEVYGAVGPLPATLTDPAWSHLASKQALKHSATLTLNTQGHKFRHVMVWILRGPSGSGGGQVDIAELAILP
jgi:hypothetical protein